jgi:hypothetical protein
VLGWRQQQSVEQFIDEDELEEMQKKGLSLKVSRLQVSAVLICYFKVENPIALVEQSKDNDVLEEMQKDGLSLKVGRLQLSAV